MFVRHHHSIWVKISIYRLTSIARGRSIPSRVNYLGMSGGLPAINRINPPKNCLSTDKYVFHDNHGRVFILGLVTGVVSNVTSGGGAGVFTIFVLAEYVCLVDPQTRQPHQTLEARSKPQASMTAFSGSVPAGSGRSRTNFCCRVLQDGGGMRMKLKSVLLKFCTFAWRSAGKLGSEISTRCVRQ